MKESVKNAIFFGGHVKNCEKIILMTKNVIRIIIFCIDKIDEKKYNVFIRIISLFYAKAHKCIMQRLDKLFMMAFIAVK